MRQPESAMRSMSMSDLDEDFLKAGFAIIKRDAESVKVENKEMKCQSTVSLIQPDGRSPVEKAIENCERWLRVASGNSIGMGKPYIVPQGRPISSGPCESCADKTLGAAIGNLAHGIWGAFAYFAGIGAASKEVMQSRIEICQQCDALDTQGERIVRMIDGEPYCGSPLLQNVGRINAKDGCGCPLKKKVARKTEKCPIGRW